MDINTQYRKLPIFKIIPILSEFTEIAIVDEPAIDEYFLKFSVEEIKLEFSKDKQIITGPVMLPGKLIYRNDAIGERFVTYDEDGVRQAAELFMKNGLKFNSEHTDSKMPISIIESYFASDGNSFGVPKGSWIVSAKVNDLEVWDKIKKSELGFSFQSLFSNELIGSSNINFNKQTQKEQMNLKEKLSTAINAVLFGETTPEVTAEVVTVEEFAEVVTVEEFAEVVTVEEFAEVPVVEPVVEPTVEVEKPEPISKEEEVQGMIDEAIVGATEQIMQAVMELLAPKDAQMVEMSKQLETFSKQPLSQPITETVNNTSTDSTYSYLQGVKFN